MIALRAYCVSPRLVDLNMSSNLLATSSERKLNPGATDCGLAWREDSSMPLAEYIYIDDIRLNSYFEQISPPVKYEKVSDWNFEVGVSGPKAQRHQSTSGRTFTQHEKVKAVVDSVCCEYPNRLPTVMDAVEPSANGTWAGFALETLRVRRVLFHDVYFGDIPIWVCESTFEYSVTNDPLWRFLIEDYPRRVGDNNLACAISTYSFLFRQMSSQVCDLDKLSHQEQIVDAEAIRSRLGGAASAVLLTLLARSRPDVGPLRDIDVLYRVRDVSTLYVASGGCGELYAYPIFIAEHPSPFSADALQAPR
jgi:hypothetical protein